MITFIYIAKLGFFIEKTNISAQKIDCSLLIIYKIVLTGFLNLNKLGKV